MAHNDQLCQILVCESSQRWTRAVRGFVGKKQSRNARQLSSLSVQSVKIGEARAMMTSVQPLAVLWELPGADRAQLVRAIGNGARSHLRPLQIGCFPADCEFSRWQRDEIAIAVRRLGVSSVLENPEDLRVGLRLIERFFQNFFATANAPKKSADLEKS